MSAFRNPVGPQPPRIYWRRRLLVLLVILAVIALAVFLLTRGGADDASTGAATAPSANASPGASASADGGAGGGATAGTTAADPSVSCDPTVITVEAVTDTNAYAAGQLPQLSFRVNNTGTVPCTLNLGTTQQAFLVSSGEEPYWSSKDCETGAVDAPVVLEPNLPQTSTPIAWDRTRSSVDTCEATDEAQVPAGGATYALTVTVAGIESDQRSFILN